MCWFSPSDDRGILNASSYYLVPFVRILTPSYRLPGNKNQLTMARTTKTRLMIVYNPTTTMAPVLSNLLAF